MSRDKREPAPGVGIKNLDGYANAITGDYFRALGIGKLDWQKALKEFESGNSAAARLLRDLRNSRILINQHMPAQANLYGLEQYGRVNTSKTKTALALLGSTKIAESLTIADVRQLAAQSFFEYFFNPYNESKGGPCKQCGQYWVKKNKRQTAYCSKACGSKHTALVSNRKRRLRDRARLVKIAESAVAEWARSRDRAAWKEFVVNAHPEIKKKFLSQLVKNGELIEPVKRKSVTRGD